MRLAMLNLLLSFLSNVLLVVLAFCVTMLLFLWAIGKQKAGVRRKRGKGASGAAAEAARARAEAMRRSSTEWLAGHSGDDDDGMGMRPSMELSSAAVQRRLSFSATTPTPPVVRSGRERGIGIERHQRRSLASGTPGRRVTFSLTPEQQQNEYDKRASDSLARRRAASVVTDPVGSGPLVELFPSNSSNRAPSMPIPNSSYISHNSAKVTHGLAPPSLRPYDQPAQHSAEVPNAPFAFMPQTKPMTFRSLRDASLYSSFVSTSGNFMNPTCGASRHAPLIPTKRKQDPEASSRVPSMLPKRVRTVGDLNSVDMAQSDRELTSSRGARHETRRRPPPVAIPA